MKKNSLETSNKQATNKGGIIMKKNYSERTLRRRADAIGLCVEKGYQQYMVDSWGFVKNEYGEKVVGYQLFDPAKGVYVWGGYNDMKTHCYSLAELEEVLMKKYEALGKQW